MSYILNKTNGAIVATVQDASLDLSTDLVFLGRNYAGYGESQNENFVRLLENFANTTAPSKPIEGEIWYNTTDKRLNFYDGADWKGVANLTTGTSNPINLNNLPPAGNFWYNELEEQLYASNGSEYVLIGPPIGADTKAGWRGSYEQDDAQRGILIYNTKAVVGSDILATVSAQEYTIFADSSGPYPLLPQSTNVPRLHRGINLTGADAATGVSYTGAANDCILWGTAAHALSANSATTSGGTTFTVKSDNVYRPVSFLSTASNGEATLHINGGFTYNASTNYVKATRFEGVATSALYADLAERYEADAVYDPGTVLVIGGEKEVTISTTYADTRVAGIVSKNPAYMMNSEAGTDETHPYIALKGRVPCKVVGNISKGDLLVTSAFEGYATNANGSYPGAIIGKALENQSEGFGVIEVLVV
jgi:hypothetical protein